MTLIAGILQIGKPFSYEKGFFTIGGKKLPRLSGQAAFSKVEAVVKNRNDSYLQIGIVTIKCSLK